MQQNISFQEAVELTQSIVSPLTNFHYIPIENALFKTLAESIKAHRDSPPFSNSAMDGYAIHHEDKGKTIAVKGTIFAGDLDDYAMNKGECFKIMTGAKLPQGATAIVPVEETTSQESNQKTDQKSNTVTLPNEITQNQHCRFRGEEFSTNTPIIEKGERLTPSHIALLASQGITHIKAFRDFKIAIISSGDEIIEPWEECGEYQIYNSNTIGLQSLLKGYGFDAEYKGALPDNLEHTTQFIHSLKDYDVILSTGGVSMGDADFVGKAFLDNGLVPAFHKIKLKPGKPVLVGNMASTTVFALPGNPMSSFLTALLLAIPAMLKKQGSKQYHFNSVIAKNTTAFKTARAKTVIVLGVLKGGAFEAIDKNRYGSNMIAPLVMANAVAIFDEERNAIDEGENITVIPLYAPLIDTPTTMINFA